MIKCIIWHWKCILIADYDMFTCIILLLGYISDVLTIWALNVLMIVMIPYSLDITYKIYSHVLSFLKSTGKERLPEWWGSVLLRFAPFPNAEEADLSGEYCSFKAKDACLKAMSQRHVKHTGASPFFILESGLIRLRVSLILPAIILFLSASCLQSWGVKESGYRLDNPHSHGSCYYKHNHFFNH